MKNQLFWVFALISAVSCSQLQILSSPKSVEFKAPNDLPSESLSDVLAATLGYSVSSSLKWNGLFINDPFNTADAVIAVVVEGAEQLKNDDAKTFNLIGNPDFAETLESRAMEHSHLAYEVEFSGMDESVTTPFGELSASKTVKDVNYLKPQSNRYDREILNQIALLDSLTSQMTQDRELPSALVARISLKYLVAEHGNASLAVAEAKKLLQASIDNLNIAVNKVYLKNAVVAVVLVDEHSVSRSKRQAKQDETPTDYNLAPIYSKYYPVMFNIILWFSVVLFFSLLAISLAISGMEDKDSIIYRMTSTRMKKDN